MKYILVPAAVAVSLTALFRWLALSFPSQCSETRIELALGPTPGLFILHLESQGQRAVIASDICHHLFQVSFPNWAPRFDLDPVKALEARISFLRQYADTETLVIPSHCPGPIGGYIATDGTAWRWKQRSP